MQYVREYNICAVLNAAVTMGYFFGSPRLNDRQNRMYGFAGCLVLLEGSLNLFTLLLDGHAPDGIVGVNHLLYLCILHTLPPLMFAYVTLLTGRYLKRWQEGVALIPYGVEMLLLFTSPLTGWIFRVEDRFYHQGPYFAVLYVGALFYILLTLTALLTAKKYLVRRKKVAAASFVVLQMTAVCVQYFNPQYLLVDLAAAMSLLVMYIAIHSSGEVTDSLTQVYNNVALNTLMAARYEEKKRFLLLGYEVSGLRRINEVYGDTYGDGLLCYVAKALKEIVGGTVARVYGGEFCVLLDGKITPEEAAARAALVPTVWEDGDYEAVFDVNRVVLRSEDFSSQLEITEMLEFAFRMAQKSGTQNPILMNQQFKTQYYRRERVHEAITNALAENRVEVVYQPIVETGTGRVIAAEALCRLTDPNLGPVSPAEFIPVAEQSGLILQLGVRVRDIVWNLLKHYDIRKAGLDHISVNLSAVECTQQSVMDTIVEEAEQARLEEGLMDFEITETAAISSIGILAARMEQMRERGFSFHLDDYGTGYSGITNLITLPFSMVKLDKSILNLAEDTARGGLVKGMIDPFHDYQIRVVCEGVETPSQVHMVTGWGVDYLQGYLYSKPLSQEDFLKFAGIEKREA